MTTPRAENKEALRAAWLRFDEFVKGFAPKILPFHVKGKIAGPSEEQIKISSAVWSLIHSGRWNVEQVDNLSALIRLLFSLSGQAEPHQKNRERRTPVRRSRSPQGPFLPFLPLPESA